jgi:hypothetical protein
MTTTFTSATVGTTYGGIENGYPFQFNVIGGTLDYEQIYSSTAFSGPITFNTITFFDTQIPGTVVASGNYEITFSYTSSPLNSNYPVGTGTQTFFDGVLGGPSGTSFSISGTPFVYDPSLGNLLIDVHITDQATGSGAGFDRDGFTSVVSRAWAGYSDNSGLVTQFSTAVWERLTNDTGSSKNDLITNDATLTGSGLANAVVHFTVDGSLISDTATADGSGMWDFTPSGLGQGAHTIVASETDTAGTTKTASLTFTLDTIAPTPFMSDVIKNTNNSLSTLSGMSEANSTVSVLDGNKLLGMATADNFGNWSLQAKITGNVHQFTETATDLAGNTGSSAGVTLYSPSANHSLVGGSGNDFLIAANKDTLTGGPGNDAFVFNANFGKVVVNDFDVNNDTLWLSNAVSQLAQALSQAHDTTAGAVITVDAHNTITLPGVTVAELAAHPSDFHFF